MRFLADCCGRVGESAVFHLLTETCVFLALPNGCLCQMTGDPIVHLKPPQIGEAFLQNEGRIASRGVKRRCIKGYSEERPSKRLKRTHTDSGQGSNIRNRSPERYVGFYTTLEQALRLCSIMPADVAFVRARMFYSRPSFVPHTKKMVVGLPPKRSFIFDPSGSDKLILIEQTSSTVYTPHGNPVPLRMATGQT